MPSAATQPTETETVSAEEKQVKDIEDRAHAQHALLSSDAIRYVVGECPKTLTLPAFLDAIIAAAKTSYPTEDGWVVINHARLTELLERQPDLRTGPAWSTVPSEAATPAAAPLQRDEVPEGAGSLAEAILAGNVAAAYQLIGNRPMLALADASADFDGLYRQKLGRPAAVSELLTQQAKQLDPEKIKAAIAALTSALDGVYTNEREAVRVAIMKAIKALA